MHHLCSGRAIIVVLIGPYTTEFPLDFNCVVVAPFSFVGGLFQVQICPRQFMHDMQI
jgi:hypothetical protein